MFFSTLNSVYEVDLEEKRVRRIEGREAPTARQGPDGVWKTFDCVTEIKVGGPVLFSWGELNNVLKTTLTSDVEKVWE